MDKRLHISCNWLGESSSGGMCNNFQFSINFLLLQLLQSYLKGLHIPPLEDSPNQLHEMCNRLSIGLYRRILYIKHYVIEWDRGGFSSKGLSQYCLKLGLGLRLGDKSCLLIYWQMGILESKYNLIEFKLKLIQANSLQYVPKV